jgi:hypothetical protein
MAFAPGGVRWRRPSRHPDGRPAGDGMGTPRRLEPFENLITAGTEEGYRRLDVDGARYSDVDERLVTPGAARRERGTRLEAGRRGR